MVFTYFDNPEKFSPAHKGMVKCATCGKDRVCFDASLYYGTEKISAICHDCLAGGELVNRNIFTCEGDQAELRQQVKALHPAWTEAEISKVVEEKTSALEKTTPYLLTWQDGVWPCADGDYCAFIGYGSRPLYKALADGASGEGLFLRSLVRGEDEDDETDFFWDDVVPEEAIADHNASMGYGVLFYVFRSLPSSRIITLWDRE
jgi:uncharacterized protein CbrC (UPF0167 family)